MENQAQTVITAAAKPNQKWFLTWRIIYPILGIVLLLEVITGVKSLLTPPAKSRSASQTQPITTGKIVLAASKKNFSLAENIPVRVNVFTGGQATAGTDVVLHFNPKKLQALSFDKGKIYDDYPLVKIDNTVGLIRISAVTAAGKKGFAGGGDLGKANFKARQPGETSLTINFKKGATYDSNIMTAADSQDILSAVTNLTLEIK